MQEEELENLLQDKDTRIQETTWGILRNLASCTGGSEGIGADLVLGKIGWDKLRAHVERVTSSSGAATTGPHGRILEHAIFFVANITGSLERAKGLVMERCVHRSFFCFCARLCVRACFCTYICAVCT